jgi:hypothetical protein
MSKDRRRIDGQFVPHLLEMLDSPAYRILSLSARRILDRLEIEWAGKGGTANGKLIVTFAQFHDYGVHWDAIAPASRELVALGFIEVTQRGRAGNAEWRRPSQYRITYLPTADAAPTHEWRHVTTDDADMIAKSSRRPGRNSRQSARPKNRNPPPETGASPPPETGVKVRKPECVAPETGVKPRPRKPEYYLEALHLRLEQRQGRAVLLLLLPCLRRRPRPVRSCCRRALWRCPTFRSSYGARPKLA